MQWRHLIAITFVAAAVSACGSPNTPQADEPAQATQARATRISIYSAVIEPLELTDSAVGWVDSKSAPMLTAEVSGRLTQIRFDAGERVEKGTLLAQVDPAPYRSARDAAAAEVQRLQVLTENQQRQVERHQRMLEENFIAASMVEETQAQLKALQEQLQAARARLDNAERDLRNTRVVAPVGGEIDQRLVAAGDFVQAGQPLLRLVSGETLRIHLPFPETTAHRLRPGLAVRLTTPLAPDEAIEGVIRELRPSLSRGRAIEAIIEAANPGSWRGGASVRGTVVLEQRESVMVPELAVVMRPAGHTVYVVEDDRVRARLVQTGHLRDGKLEILSGLEAGKRIALDGAGFLTDGALISIRESAQ